MRKILKYLQVFLFWLAGLTLSAHLIIPHDHHQGDEDLCQSNSCPASKSNPGRRTGLPLHCHAFNDLAAEKFSPIIKQEIQTGFISLVWLPDYIIPEVNLLQTTPLDSGKPFPDIYVPDYYPFRAPPSVG